MRRLSWLVKVWKEKTAGITATRAKTIFYSYSCLLRNRMSSALQCQCPAQNDILDPFLHYPYFLAQLYYASLSLELEEVNPSWVVSHYI